MRRMTLAQFQAVTAAIAAAVALLTVTSEAAAAEPGLGPTVCWSLAAAYVLFYAVTFAVQGEYTWTQKVVLAAVVCSGGALLVQAATWALGPLSLPMLLAAPSAPLVVGNWLRGEPRVDLDHVPYLARPTIPEVPRPSRPGAPRGPAVTPRGPRPGPRGGLPKPPAGSAR
jgi:hypothetical protein